MKMSLSLTVSLKILFKWGLTYENYRSRGGSNEPVYLLEEPWILVIRMTWAHPKCVVDSGVRNAHIYKQLAGDAHAELRHVATLGCTAHGVF